MAHVGHFGIWGPVSRFLQSLQAQVLDYFSAEVHITAPLLLRAARTYWRYVCVFTYIYIYIYVCM